MRGSAVVPNEIARLGTSKYKYKKEETEKRRTSSEGAENNH